MRVARIAGGAATAALLYAAFAIDAVWGGRTLSPQWALVVLILGAWSLPLGRGVALAAFIGIVTDALGAGRLGPGTVAAVMTTALAIVVRERARLQSALAVLVFTMLTGSGVLAGRRLVAALLERQPLTVASLQLDVARGMSCAFAASLLLATWHIVTRVVRSATAVLLRV